MGRLGRTGACPCMSCSAQAREAPSWSRRPAATVCASRSDRQGTAAIPPREVWQPRSLRRGPRP
eukprot:7750836-Alexandrium_andersonii.AAC.1